MSNLFAPYAATTCVYVFPGSGEMKFNPYGPEEETRKGGGRLWSWLEDRQFSTVCGWNYVALYDQWRTEFETLLTRIIHKKGRSSFNSLI